MNCLQSLWTGTPMFKPQRGPLLVHTLALCLAHEHFDRVKLVTDRGGLEIAELLGWRYTSYLNVLEELTHGAPRHIWSLGKLRAILEQTEPFLQIDGDVLFTKPPAREIRHARLVAQSIDYPQFYLGADMRAAMERVGLRPGRVAYNCGVLGGTDLRLLHAYAEEALEMAAKFPTAEINGTTTSMILEQYHLADFARRHGVRVETILPLHYGRDEESAAGYVHMTGDRKRDPVLVGACECLLKADYPAEYQRFLDGWARIGKPAAASPASYS